MSSGPTFSPLENEPPLRWLRRLRLAPAHGLATGRRALVLSLLTWGPIAAWAALSGRWAHVVGGETLLQHYGVHVRCLLAVPLLLLAEVTLHKTAQKIMRQLDLSNLVPPGERPRFDQVMRDVRRLRDGSMPWVLMLGVVVAWVAATRPSSHDDALSWAAGANDALGFGGLWFAYFVRPVFIALVLSWLWRLLLVTYWFWRIGRLELSIVPTHPDRAGGLGFVEDLPGAFAPVTFVLSATISSHWAHLIIVHGAELEAFKIPALAFVLLWTLCLLLPLLALAPALIAARARAIPLYSALVGEQGRLVHRRWILREPVGDAPLLDAPEIGPVADAATMHEAVWKMRTAPIGLRALTRILVPIALPFLVVIALRVPLKTLLLQLLKALA